MYPNFTEKEWEQILENAFSPDAPEPPFSKSYHVRRLAMEKEFVMKKKRSVRKSTIKILAIAAAAAIMTPAAVIAGMRMYEARMEQTNTYQRTVKINPGDEVSEEIMTYQIGWIPEDMTSIDNDGKSDECFGVDRYQMERHCTFDFLKIAEGAELTSSVFGVTDTETFTTASGNQVFYSASEQNGIDRGDIWIAFSGTRYAAYLWTMDITEEEMHQIVENISLTPTDVEIAHEWVPFEDADRSVKAEIRLSEDYNAPPLSVGSYSEMRQISIGETARGTSDRYSEISHHDVCVNSITLQDNFDGITTDSIGSDADFSEYLDENGKITTIRQHIRRGNEITTIDEVESEETIQQYVLRINATFTNTGDENEYIGVQDYLFRLNNDNMLPYYAAEDRLHYVTTGELIQYGYAFSFYTDHEHSKNVIKHVAPGESVDVELAFLVDEDWFGNLYLSLQQMDYLNGDTGLPVLDLCDIRPE